MFSFYPVEKESRLIKITQEQLYENLEKYVKPVRKDISDQRPNGYLFNGTWDKERLSISIKLKISNNFVPIIHGNILPAEAGILIKFTYELFPATKKLLTFWTVLTLLITIFFTGIYQAWLYGAISFSICLVNYVLSRENFKIQVRKSKRVLEKLLS